MESVFKFKFYDFKESEFHSIAGMLHSVYICICVYNNVQWKMLVGKIRGWHSHMLCTLIFFCDQNLECFFIIALH